MKVEDFLRDFRQTSTEIHAVAQSEQQLTKFIANLNHALNTLRSARHVFQYVEGKASELEQLPFQLPKEAETLRQEVEGLRQEVNQLKEARDTAHAEADAAEHRRREAEDICQLRMAELQETETALRRELGVLERKRSALAQKLSLVLETEEEGV